MKNRFVSFILLIPIILIGCSSQEESFNIDSLSSHVTSSENSSSINSSEVISSSIQISSSEQSSSEIISSSIQSSSEQVSSSEAPTVPNYVLHGLFGDDYNWTDKTMRQNPSNTNEYMIQGVYLSAGDIFKIHMDGDNWYGYSKLKTAVPDGLVEQTENDDNIIVLISGNYDIYCSKYGEYGKHIYLDISDNHGPSSDVIPVNGISLDRTGKFLTYRITTFTLNAKVYPENATNKEVVWTSSDTSIASVSKGRIVTYEKTGTTIITAKTVDGNKTAECRIYVNASGIPDYYLTGIINGRNYSAKTYTYAAIPIEGGKYLIPDVTLKSGDKLNVRGDNGKAAILKNRYNQNYEYQPPKDMSVNITLNPNDSNYNYLSFAEKY